MWEKWLFMYKGYSVRLTVDFASETGGQKTVRWYI